MVRYRISQLAERVGVPATTLRYYETQGLLPAQRTPSGYRSYDDRDVERVRFIATAKDLGLPLARIRDLLGIWQDGMCRDVRRRLVPLVDEQITDLDTRLSDLHAVRRHLTEAQERLRALPARNTPCSPDCAFLTGASSTSESVAPVKPDAPVACSLSAGHHTARLKDWQAALAGAAPRRLDDGTIRTAVPTSRLAEIATLIADEATCCPFLHFTITVTHDGARLDATAPRGAGALLDDLFAPDLTEGDPC
ncbi:MerR family transcriptional regulator [Pseudonocardia alni]|uniref:MerR family transcriptional regulator n=1 Tax=Pseudonocardia alni TaxID=33907 RepID=UPI00280C27D4|nr:MerR family transcriptional regulator [Pseudonocardia alni]